MKFFNNMLIHKLKIFDNEIKSIYLNFMESLSVFIKFCEYSDNW
jgi:hypothetical protein